MPSEKRCPNRDGGINHTSSCKLRSERDATNAWHQSSLHRLQDRLGVDRSRLPWWWRAMLRLSGQSRELGQIRDLDNWNGAALPLQCSTFRGRNFAPCRFKARRGREVTPMAP